MEIIKIFIQFLCLFFFTSCQSYFDSLKTEELEFTLPSLELYHFDSTQEENLEISKWKVEIYSKGVSNEFLWDSGTIKIQTEKNKPLCVVATPILKKAENEFTFFKPAGTIYPYTENSLTWEKGFSATVMKLLWNSKKETYLSDDYLYDFISRFNWKKFQDTIDEKTASSILKINNQEETDLKVFYNPWQIDFQELLDELSFAEFKTSLLNPKGVYNIEFPKNLKSAKSIYSSYVPENLFIAKNKFVTVQKNELNTLLIDNNHLGILSFDSIKNVSVTRVSLPIFLEE